MLTNSSRRSENEVQIYACNAQIAYIDNTKSRARRYTSKRVRFGNMYIPMCTLFFKKYPYHFSVIPVQLNKHETAPNFIQLSQNLTSNCLG